MSERAKTHERQHGPLHRVEQQRPGRDRLRSVIGLEPEQHDSDTDRQHLVTNIVDHLGRGVERFIQERAVKEYWGQVDPELGAQVAKGLGLKTGK